MGFFLKARLAVRRWKKKKKTTYAILLRKRLAANEQKNAKSENQILRNTKTIPACKAERLWQRTAIQILSRVVL